MKSENIDFQICQSICSYIYYFKKIETTQVGGSVGRSIAMVCKICYKIMLSVI